MLRFLPALICLAVGWVGVAMVTGAALPGRETGARVVFVGRAFDVNQGVLSSFDRMGVAGWDAYPPPLQANFMDGDVDAAHVARILERYRPDVVVLQAFPHPDQGLGWQATMAETMAQTVALARDAGAAEIVIVAHPPAKPSGTVGYLAANRKIEAVVRKIADDAGARLALAGAFFADMPHEDRIKLYSTRGWAYTEAGELAVALSVAAALGATAQTPLGPEIAREPEPGFFDGWAERALRLAEMPA